MLYLLNSKMMPQPGTYKMQPVTTKDAAAIIKKQAGKDNLKSFVGYPQNRDIIHKETGIYLSLNRNQLTGLKSGDAILAMTIPYRLSNPGTKGDRLQVSMLSDFDFNLITYTAP